MCDGGQRISSLRRAPPRPPRHLSSPRLVSSSWLPCLFPLPTRSHPWPPPAPGSGSEPTIAGSLPGLRASPSLAFPAPVNSRGMSSPWWLAVIKYYSLYVLE
ncbi:hypothetical protein PVAP13_3KG376786 [Panicum virgatum]|uniref:Uncharacterized protein n=1 Tax=Panicum virgatum TaxID=38727 RepID=A0A8T0UVA6_PANVG|nr:hypothetical protein PVAP13_3KG376786 [Panicum virgatum]